MYKTNNYNAVTKSGHYNYLVQFLYTFLQTHQQNEFRSVVCLWLKILPIKFLSHNMQNFYTQKGRSPKLAKLQKWNFVRSLGTL